MLLGALLCGIAGPSFVGCKDYDDDIDNLQVQIDQNKDAIAKLQELVNGGAIVTSVKSDGNGGVIITLSDGTTHNITKGEKGDDGDQGPDGVAGQTPIFQISNGELQVRYSTEDEWESLGKVTPEAEELNFVVDETTGDLMLNGTSIGHVAGEAGKPLAVDFRVTTEGVLEYQNQEGEWVEIGNVKGAEGATPQLVFQMVDGKLQYKDNNAIGAEWADVAGFDMSTILAGYMDLTVNAEDGFLYVGETKTDVQVNYNIYLVEKEGAMILHLPYNDPTEGWIYRDITLPTTDIFSKMITSADFVPMFSEKGDLTMYKLVAEVAPNKEYLASNSVLRFRVSPNTAAYGTDYTIAESMDYFLTSRAAQETPLFSVAYNEALTKENNDGLVYVNFSFDQSKVDMKKDYTLALALNDLHNEGRMVYSDYIKFSPKADEVDTKWMLVQGEELVAPGPDEEVAVQVLRKEGATVDVANLLVYAGSVDNATWTTLENLGFDNITYKFEFAEGASDLQKTFISINGSVITVLDASFQVSQENSVPLKVSAMIGGEVLSKEDIKVNIVDNLTPTPVTGEVAIIKNISVSNTGVAMNDVPLELVSGGLNELNSFFDELMDEADFTFNVVNAEGETVESGFTFDGNLANGITVDIAADVEVGTYTATLTFTFVNDTKNMTANVPFTIAVTKPEIVYAANGRWDANHTMLGVRINKTGGYETDLNTAFVCDEGKTKMKFRIDEESIEGMEFNATDGKIIVKSFDELPDEIWENGVKVYYQLMGGENYAVALSEEKSCIVEFTNPIGTLSSTVNTINIMDGSYKTIPFEEELGLVLRGYDPVLSETLDLIVDGLDSEEDNYTVTFDYAVASNFEATGKIVYDEIEEVWKWQADETVESAADVPVVLTVTVTFNNGTISEQTLDITLHIEPEAELQ